MAKWLKIAIAVAIIAALAVAGYFIYKKVRGQEPTQGYEILTDNGGSPDEILVDSGVNDEGVHIYSEVSNTPKQPSLGDLSAVYPHYNFGTPVDQLNIPSYSAKTRVIKTFSRQFCGSYDKFWKNKDLRARGEESLIQGDRYKNRRHLCLWPIWSVYGLRGSDNEQS